MKHQKPKGRPSMHGATVGIFAALGLAAAAVGCGSNASDEVDTETAGEDPGEHACEQVGTTGSAVTAAADRDAAQRITSSEQPYTVTMPADAVTGYLVIQGPAQALLFTREVGEVTALYEGTATDSVLPQGSPNQYCPDDLAEHFHLDLESPSDYTIQLTSAADTVWLVLLSGEGHTHEA